MKFCIPLPSSISLRVLLLSLLLLGIPQQSAYAQQAESREQAAQIALDRHGSGKVLGVREKTRDDGSTYFEVKILKDGEVSIYVIGYR